jgi:putative hydrolase of the HAD superfamily
VTRALLLDLDDTLVPEEGSTVAAFAATARAASERHPVDARRLALDARSRARELWRAAPTFPYCQRIGMSSWEGLWCRFEGDEGELPALRAWAPAYKREAWRRALADQSVENQSLAEELAQRFETERRARREPFADVAGALDVLGDRFALAVVTNGASCLQREKLAASGLADRFDAVVVSGELGSAKPDPAVFAHALRALGAEPAEAVMVGDSLSNDVDGALAAGLGAVWVNRDGRPRPPDRPNLVEVADLAGIPAMLAAAR